MRHYIYYIIMVFYFDTNREDGIFIFLGRDKFENEQLIKYGIETDIWFHGTFSFCYL